jgi:hypothetical protein
MVDASVSQVLRDCASGFIVQGDGLGDDTFAWDDQLKMSAPNRYVQSYSPRNFARLFGRRFL